MDLLSSSNGASRLKREKSFPINNRCWHRHSTGHKVSEGGQSLAWSSQVTHGSVLLNGASFCPKHCSNSGRGENIPLRLVKRDIQPLCLWGTVLGLGQLSQNTQFCWLFVLLMAVVLFSCYRVMQKEECLWFLPSLLHSPVRFEGFPMIIPGFLQWKFQ